MSDRLDHVTGHPSPAGADDHHLGYIAGRGQALHIGSRDGGVTHLAGQVTQSLMQVFGGHGNP